MAKVIILPLRPGLGQGQKQRLRGILMRLSTTQASANLGCRRPTPYLLLDKRLFVFPASKLAGKNETK